MPQSKMVVKLSHQDIPDIVPLVLLASKDLPYTSEANPEAIERFLDQIPDCLRLGLVNDEGSIQGVLLGCKSYLPLYFTPVAVELLWYILPEYRRGRYALQMVREFEKWAVQNGCQMITMGNMANDYMQRTGEFYQRLGYKLSEQTYFKDL